MIAFLKNRLILTGQIPAMFLIVAICPALAIAQEESDSAEKTEQQQREQQFGKSLTNKVLVGSFTIDGQADQPKEERYELKKVTRLRDDLWVFNARVKYGKTDITLPIILKVVWAEDTPMISMTNVTIPGLGTFTCRVFFYENRYAGTWQHGKKGGHMFGRIETATTAENASSENTGNDRPKMP